MPPSEVTSPTPGAAHLANPLRAGSRGSVLGRGQDEEFLEAYSVLKSCGTIAMTRSPIWKAGAAGNKGNNKWLVEAISGSTPCILHPEFLRANFHFHVAPTPFFDSGTIASTWYA